MVYRVKRYIWGVGYQNCIRLENQMEKENGTSHGNWEYI